MKKKIFLIILAIIVLLTGILMFSLQRESKEDTVIIINDAPEILLKYDYDKVFKENKDINSDFKGLLVFESGLITKPVVQGKTNDTYLRKDWMTGNYDLYGSVFFDAVNKINDQNLIIYGHNTFKSLDEEGEMVFTPLELLIEQENYEDNKIVYLCLEDEIRKYEIVSVYYCELEDYLYAREDMQFNLPVYSKEYFPVYHDTVKRVEFYDTGEDFNIEDNLLTLQTCVKGDESKREIVIGKEVERFSTKNPIINDILDIYFGE